MVEPLLKTSHHVRRNRKGSVSYGAAPYMALADAHLNKVTRSTVAIAEEPDVRCHMGAFDVCFECRADLNMGHVPRKTPDVLRREVVPVVRGLGGDFCCKPVVPHSYNVMSSRHVRMDMIIDDCTGRCSGDEVSTTSLKR